MLTTEERDKLILDHIPLLRHLVGRMSLDTSRVDRDDVYGFGMLGLIAATDAWEKGRGLEFSTFAYTKIRGAILDELRRTDFLPRGRRDKVRRLDRVVTRLEQERGLPPTPEELAERMGLPIEEVDEILLTARTAYDVSLQDGDERTLGTMLSDPKSCDPVGSAEWEETKAALVKAIEDLPDQERTVVALYYAEDLLLKEIGELLGVSESRVSQIHTRALYRLNRKLASLVSSEN